MKKIDYLSLDGKNFLVFIAVLEELSVTKAAERLGVTQSSVSHTLDKLRAGLGDPLFVRSGRGIAPTERALSLHEPVLKLLDQLKMLTDSRRFDPTDSEMVFKVAANDFQRSLIFPPISKLLYKKSINVQFTFLPSKIPDLAMLRAGHCDLMITPFPPDGSDIFQVRLFSDDLKCFFDGSIREAPATRRELLNSNYIDVVFEHHQSVMQALSTGYDKTYLPKPSITVPNFDALAEFILGTDLITVQTGKMIQTSLKDLDCTHLPFKTQKLHIYMAWHRRFKCDPAHIWLRELIVDTCRQLK